MSTVGIDIQFEQGLGPRMATIFGNTKAGVVVKVMYSTQDVTFLGAGVTNGEHAVTSVSSNEPAPVSGLVISEVNNMVPPHEGHYKNEPQNITPNPGYDYKHFLIQSKYISEQTQDIVLMAWVKVDGFKESPFAESQDNVYIYSNMNVPAVSLNKVVKLEVVVKPPIILSWHPISSNNTKNSFETDYINIAEARALEATYYGDSDLKYKQLYSENNGSAYQTLDGKTVMRYPDVDTGATSDFNHDMEFCPSSACTFGIQCHVGSGDNFISRAITHTATSNIKVFFYDKNISQGSYICTFESPFVASLTLTKRWHNDDDPQDFNGRADFQIFDAYGGASTISMDLKYDTDDDKYQFVENLYNVVNP